MGTVPAPPSFPGLPPSGWEGLDELLQGWPDRGLVELVGRGRTTLALGTVAAAQARDGPVAWIDGPGVFCPATAPVDLARLALVQTSVEPFRAATEARELESWEAGRRGGAARGRGAQQRGRSTGRPRTPASRALFAADTLLRSRAFALVVLDLAPSPREPATWFRLARLAVGVRTLLLLLQPGEALVGGSAAALALGVRLRPAGAASPWSETPAALEVSVRRHRSAAAGRQVRLALREQP
jgi:hypothetical protein